MANKSLFSQFVGSWVRQMGRESAHTAYGEITGKNTRESFGEVKELKSFPTVIDYVKLFFAQLIPFIGPIWGAVKGISRLLSKNIQYLAVVDKSIYKLDRRYSDSQRYVGTEEVTLRSERLKADSPEKDVKRYNTHAIIYIIIGIISIAIQWLYFDSLPEKDNKAEQNALSSYTKWNSVSITDDFTETTETYELLFPTVDSVASKKVVLMKKEGKYYLLSSSSSLFDFDYSKDSAPIDIKTENGVKSIGLKKHKLESTDILTPENKKEYFPDCYVIPSGIIPQKGILQIRSKGIIYSFDLDKAE